MGGVGSCSIRGRLELSFPRNFLFEALLRVAPDSTLAVTTADREAWEIAGRLPTTLFFWGPTLRLRLLRLGAELTEVVYEAEGQERQPGQRARFAEYTRARVSQLLRDAVALMETSFVGAR